MNLNTCLKYFPFSDERVITEFKEEISQAFLHDLKSVNQEENKFWKDLIRACLEPASDAFGFEEILKGSHMLKSTFPKLMFYFLTILMVLFVCFVLLFAVLFVYTSLKNLSALKLIRSKKKNYLKVNFRI